VAVGTLEGTIILLVDDEALVRRSLTRSLERAGCRVLAAESLQEARELLEKRIDVLVTDINLGTDSGVTLAEEAGQRLPLMLLFAISGGVSSAEAFALGRAGVEAILRKPITGEQLVVAISQAEDPGMEVLDRAVRRKVGSATLNEVLDRVRRTMVSEALARTDQTKAHAAAELGISRQHLQKLLERGQA